MSVREDTPATVAEFAIIQILNSALQGETITGKALHRPKGRQAFVAPTDLPAHSFIGRLHDGITVPVADVPKIEGVMKDAMQKSGVLNTEDWCIESKPADPAIEKTDDEPAVKLFVTVTDPNKVNIGAALKYLRGKPGNELMASVLETKAKALGV